jgi:hypothetical protein
MQKIYLLGGLVLLTIACAHTHRASNGESMLLGQHPEKDLQKKPYRTWFNPNYANYVVDTATTTILSPLLRQKDFLIFMGTWCPDSKREVPRMLHTLDACNVPRDRVHIVMVDYRDPAYKQSPGHEERGKYIAHVPDLLVFENKSEIGRIVESPVVSLEKDLLTIVNNQPYHPQYRATYWLSLHLSYLSGATLKGMSDSLRSQTNEPNELATFSRILINQGDTVHAFLVSCLDTTLFPQNAQARSYLGRTCAWMQDTVAATRAYRQALKLDTANKMAKDWLTAHSE